MADYALGARQQFRLCIIQTAFEVHYEPLRETDGPVTGGLGVAIDASGRERAEEALRLSERRWRALVEHVTDIITVLDAEGRVVYSSPAAVRVLGYPEGFWRGHSVFELVHPDDAPRVVITSSRDASDFGPLIQRSGALGFVPKNELSGEALAALLD